MKLEYRLERASHGRRPDKETLNACDEGAKAYQKLMVDIVRIVTKGKPLSRLAVALVWLVSRPKFRRVGRENISYFFPLMRG